MLPVLKWVRGEPLSQEHWSDLFRMLGIAKGMTLEKLTFGDLLAVADAIVINATALKVCYWSNSKLEIYNRSTEYLKWSFNDRNDWITYSLC